MSTPVMNDITANGLTISYELAWLEEVISTRLQLYFGQECAHASIDEVDVPDLADDFSNYAQLCKDYKLSTFERLLLILTLAPHIRPQLLDFFFLRNSTYDRPFTEFGGAKPIHHTGFIPTAETILFLLAELNTVQRIRLRVHLFEDSLLTQMRIVQLGTVAPDEPTLAGTLSISEEYVSLLCTGERGTPEYSPDFPASRVKTSLNWDDLILDYPVMEEVREIETWIQHSESFLKDPHLRKHLKPGYRALLYGPPGTGKTLTASLIGKSTGLDVYRIDLSMIVSKYIGETEKNLGKVFDLAQSRRWILFFDEADSLFGKRTETTSSNDRHANQQVGYLLQRIEDFPGIIILATNLKDNLDAAFLRRFQSIIQIPAPNTSKRVQLWKQTFGGPLKLDPKVDFDKLAEKYPVTGAVITNVMRTCALVSVKRQRPITQEDIVMALGKEYGKEGKTLEDIDKENLKKGLIY
ncbi:ATP-binding protein [Spirosoma linguale]|uniref:AAA ATPase central domain protein n=1 Tax=Spirosoma linguale (strain ATCC 33905 / DSM 74 / LMG 10896 / Claus 1) TaxID=504472 RepID=D2QJR1_SPILD|nr:AAA ATPase central domain protein [Spirosoma linguale DSM 74]